MGRALADTNVEPDHDRDAWLVQGQMTQIPLYSHRHESMAQVWLSVVPVSLTMKMFKKNFLA